MGIRVLLITSHFPYPANNGARIRDFNTIKCLSEKCELALMTFYEDKRQLDYIPVLERYCDKVVAVLRKSDKSKLIRNFNIITNPFFPARPFHAVNYYSREFENALRGLVRCHEFDIVQIGLLHMAQYIRSIPGEVPVVLDMHNAEHVIMARYCEIETNLLKKAYLFYQTQKLKRYEKWMCGKFDRCLAVSGKDKIEMENCCDRKAVFSVVPNGVDADYFNPVPAENNGSVSLIYHGTMSGYMNVDAVMYFYECIFPHIRTEIPDVKLTIAGANPDSRLLHLAKKDESVVVTGAVDDMRPYVAASGVAVVPLRVGGGTRLKILEAMAQGKPVVSTSVGCEGLDVTRNENVIIADDPVEFGKWVVKLLKNESLRRSIGQNGRKLVEAKYDWRLIVAQLYRIYENVIDERTDN